MAAHACSRQPTPAAAASQPLQTLGTTNVLSAPVLDEDGEYAGCISVNDLLGNLNKREWGRRQQRLPTAPACADRLMHAPLLLHSLPVMSAKDPEWYEKIEAISAADMVAVATEFTKQTVDKVLHGEAGAADDEDVRTHAQPVRQQQMPGHAALPARCVRA